MEGLDVELSGTFGNLTDRVTIDTSGYVGIGTDDPSSELHVENGSGNCGLRVISSATGVSYLNLGDTGDNNAGSIEYSNNDNYMLFKTADSEAARFDSSGNLVFPDGQGIDFSAVDGSGIITNGGILDDYEEGNWTPTLNGAFTVGDYAKQVGYYTKIGRLVHAFCRIRVLAANLSSPTSTTIGVQGLPFTVYNTGDHYPTGRGYGNLNAHAENAYLIAFPNQTTAYFYRTTTDGYSSTSGTNVGSADEIDYLFSITYQSA